MKEKISKETLTKILHLRNEPLLFENKIYVIVKVEHVNECVAKKKLLSDTKHYVVNFLTKLEIQGYHRQGKFIGTLSDYDAFQFITYYDLYKFRDNFEFLKEQLLAFGCEISKIEQKI